MALQDKVLGDKPWQIIEPTRAARSTAIPDDAVLKAGTHWWIDKSGKEPRVMFSGGSSGHCESHNSEWPDEIFDRLELLKSQKT